jgi:Homing endonuclease associated repeat/HNH endonuclease
MRRVAVLIGGVVLRERDYLDHGKYGVRTAIKRFGAWSSAVERAGLQRSVERQISDAQLFENLLNVWTGLGRQPKYSELEKPASRYHVATYERRFGSWRSALEAFVNWANATDADATPRADPEAVTKRRKTSRQPDLRMRFRVLTRDRFTCCACGVSPATTPGTKLDVDHRTPWSEGGETVESNLQTLCDRCNQGKSNCVPKS